MQYPYIIHDGIPAGAREQRAIGRQTDTVTVVTDPDTELADKVEALRY
jgi:hypothetical protein